MMRAVAEWLRQALPCTRAAADAPGPGAVSGGPVASSAVSGATAASTSRTGSALGRAHPGAAADPEPPTSTAARHRCGRHERNRFPAWRQAPRTPRDGLAELMHLVRGLPAPDGPALWHRACEGWLSGRPPARVVQDLREALAPWPAAQRLALDLCAEAAQPHLETELHFNPYGRTFESSAVDALIHDPPEAVLSVAGAAADRLREHLDTLPPAQRTQAASGLHEKLWGDVRPWFTRSTPVMAFMAPESSSGPRLDRLLRDLQAALSPGGPASGTAAIATAHVAVRLGWSILEATRRMPPWMDGNVLAIDRAKEAVGQSLPVRLDDDEVGMTAGTGLYLPGQPDFVAEPAADADPAISALDFSQVYDLGPGRRPLEGPLADMQPFAKKGLEEQYPGACGVSGSTLFGTSLMMPPKGSAPAAGDADPLAPARTMALLYVMHLVHDGGHGMREVVAAARTRMALPAGAEPPGVPAWQANLMPWGRGRRIQAEARAQFSEQPFAYRDLLDLCPDEPTRTQVQAAFGHAFERVADQVAQHAPAAAAHRAAWDQLQVADAGPAPTDR